MPPTAPQRITTTLTLTLVLLAGACTYESGNGVTGPGTSTDPTTSTGEGPEGALAFSVEGLGASIWRVYNTDDGLNLRVAPGADSDSLGRLPVDTRVTASGAVTVIEDISWFYVETDTEAGWVHSGYLTPVDSDDEAVAPVGPLAAAALIDSPWPEGTVLVVASQPGANLREGPAGDVIVELVTGANVTVTGQATEDWTEIRTSNLRGWIYTELLAEVADDTNSPFPAATPLTPGGDRTGVNIHDQPRGEILSGLPANEVALATGRSDKGWTQITHRGMTGWVRTIAVESVQPAPGSLVPTTATVEGAGGSVTVHLGPSGLEPILAELDDGSEIMTTGLSTPTSWSEVELDQARTGWVPTIFLLF